MIDTVLYASCSSVTVTYVGTKHYEKALFICKIQLLHTIPHHAIYRCIVIQKRWYIDTSKIYIVASLVHTRKHTHIYTYTHIHIHTHPRTYTHTHTHTHTTHIYTCTHTHNTHTYTHIHTHTTHTYTHSDITYFVVARESLRSSCMTAPSSPQLMKTWGESGSTDNCRYTQHTIIQWEVKTQHMNFIVGIP